MYPICLAINILASYRYEHWYIYRFITDAFMMQITDFFIELVDFVMAREWCNQQPMKFLYKIQRMLAQLLEER